MDVEIIEWNFDRVGAGVPPNQHLGGWGNNGSNLHLDNSENVINHSSVDHEIQVPHAMEDFVSSNEFKHRADSIIQPQYEHNFNNNADGLERPELDLSVHVRAINEAYNSA